MQMKYQKKLKVRQAKKDQDPGAPGDAGPKGPGSEIPKKKDVFSRLLKNDNDVTEKSTIKVDENLQIRFETGKFLYQELSKAKNEKEYRRIAREHWNKFKDQYKASLRKLKQHQFVQKFVKENKKYNIYLPDFSQDKSKQINFDDDEKRQQELLGEDEEIFIMIDKIMHGAVYQKWKSLQDKDL